MKKFIICLISLFTCVSFVACGGEGDNPYIGNVSNPNGVSGKPEGGYTYEDQAVDLGLSVKWASCNVGANKPEEYGDYFAWGETAGYGQNTRDGHQFYWKNYSLCNGSYKTMNKYCTDSYYGTVDNKTVLDKEDDAATVNLGGSWRMPTKAEQEELRNNCTWTWTTMNGVNGYKVMSKKNGSSIFLPAAGFRSDNYLYYASSRGYYWSSSLCEDDSWDAWYLVFHSNQVECIDKIRYSGRSVRAVCP